MERNDLTGKQCIEVIRTAALTDEVDDSEFLLKALVEETIVHNNGKSDEKPKKVKAKRKANPKLAAKN